MSSWMNLISLAVARRLTRASSPRGTKSLRTLRWRKTDSNRRSPRIRDAASSRPSRSTRARGHRPPNARPSRQAEIAIDPGIRG
jgi:hypothetical protein